MHTVERIEVAGFRGRPEPFAIKLDNKVNFIIGRNGTGKTSLINLINAALSGDIAGLRRAHFSELKIRLKPTGSSRRPVITYRKEHVGDGSEILNYAIQAKVSDPVNFREIEVDDDGWLASYQITLLNRSKRGMRVGPQSSALKNELENFIMTTWLSVHRTINPSGKESDRQFESPIDQRMHEVFQKFGVYFSTLDSASAKKTDRFQTNYFLSLVSPPTLSAFAWQAGRLKPEEEKSALEEIFSEFGLQSSAYTAKLENFTKRVVKAIEWREQNAKSGVPADTFLTLTDALRIESLVNEWADLIRDRERIYAPKSDFINIVNSLLFKKEIKISSGNQPIFINDAGVEINPDYLSSGEKQLLIILGEALIQRGSAFVFMADEPELSLHIDWQEKLVPSLRMINPNSQIIFATHSPDIVGAFGDCTIDLEKVLA